MEVTDCVSVIKIITHCYCFTLVNLIFFAKVLIFFLSSMIIFCFLAIFVLDSKVSRCRNRKY